MRLAMRLSYDGAEYSGYVRQPGMRTVESIFLGALGECVGPVDLRRCRYRVATRTDRGVSSLGQTVAVDLEDEVTAEEINSQLPANITVLSVLEVGEGFNPRFNAVEKHYRYVCETPRDFDINAARRVARLFEGRHDFGAFCRGEPGRATFSEIKRVIVRDTGPLVVMDFFARSFLWQQVRRISKAIVDAGRMRVEEGTIKDLLEDPRGRGFPPADPDGLFLAEVRYRGLRFSPEDAAKRRFMQYLENCGRDVCRAMLEILKNRF